MDNSLRHDHPKVGRRRFLRGAAAVPLVALIPRRGEAAEFNWKFATGQDPTHPVNIRALEAIKRIQEATGGRLEIKLFPANQLGSDTDLISQVRNGGVELLNTSASIVATLVPLSGMLNLGLHLPISIKSGRRWTEPSATWFALTSLSQGLSQSKKSATTVSGRSRHRGARSRPQMTLKDSRYAFP